MPVSELIESRLYFSPHSTVPTDTDEIHYFCIDHLLEYTPFYIDFGPLNLGSTYRFCQLLSAKLGSPKLKDKVIHYYCADTPEAISNAVCLVGIYQIVCLKRSVSETYDHLRMFEPFVHFNDASMHGTTFRLYPLHILQAMEAAVTHGWFDYDSFDCDEFLHYEQVEHGDLNVIIPGKLLAFASPYDVRHAPRDYPTFTPAAYIPIFKRLGVQTVVRFNDKLYDRRSFTAAGIRHHDIFFEDGSTPPPALVERFLSVCAAPGTGMMALHCKAGLGRAGTNAALFMMARYGVSAHVAIAWLRLCRPGSVIGQQQHFLVQQHPHVANTLAPGSERYTSFSSSSGRPGGMGRPGTTGRRGSQSLSQSHDLSGKSRSPSPGTRSRREVLARVHTRTTNRSPGRVAPPSDAARSPSPSQSNIAGIFSRSITARAAASPTRTRRVPLRQPSQHAVNQQPSSASGPSYAPGSAFGSVPPQQQQQQQQQQLTRQGTSSASASGSFSARTISPQRTARGRPLQQSPPATEGSSRWAQAGRTLTGADTSGKPVTRLPTGSRRHPYSGSGSSVLAAAARSDIARLPSSALQRSRAHAGASPPPPIYSYGLIEE